MQRRFAGQLDALTKTGKSYCNAQRFTPLRGAGKPLWEFKEFDHRLYCHRHVQNDTVLVVLFNGWIKDKKGRTDREDREIQRAISLYAEFVAESRQGEHTT